jgi:pyroglutamyl-peptidase
MKILVTGFGGFLKNAKNPAEKVAHALIEPSTRVLILPVSYLKSRALLLETLQKERPDLLLSFGLASSRKRLSLEEKAYNLLDAKVPDNDGVKKSKEAISPLGKETLLTPFDLGTLQNILVEKSIPVALSDDPGRYICNEVYYTDLESGIPALFVHLPNEKEIPLEKQIEAGRVIKDFLISSIKEAESR